MTLLLGTLPNQVPTNGDLGTMAFQDSAGVNITGGTASLNITGGTAIHASMIVNSPVGTGYATGAGGAVTQLTSRTTGVTLNTPAGAITMFSAAGSATPATFIVTDSTVSATDTILVSERSGTNLYILHVTSVSAGSFAVTFYTTGGVAVDAPVINFAVFKSAIS